MLVPVAEPGTHPSGRIKKVQVTTDEVVREVEEVLEVGDEVGGGVVVLQSHPASVLLLRPIRAKVLTGVLLSLGWLRKSESSSKPCADSASSAPFFRAIIDQGLAHRVDELDVLDGALVVL